MHMQTTVCHTTHPQSASITAHHCHFYWFHSDVTPTSFTRPTSFVHYSVNSPTKNFPSGVTPRRVSPKAVRPPLVTPLVAGPHLGNNLPLHPPDSEHSLLEFRVLLKTHLICWGPRRIVTAVVIAHHKLTLHYITDYSIVTKHVCKCKISAKAKAKDTFL